MSLPIKQYHKNLTPANQPKVLGRQCDTCPEFTPFSQLRLYRKEYLQYAPFNQENRVGKMVCPKCLPPAVLELENNTRVASKIDVLFAEIFKSNE